MSGNIIRIEDYRKVEIIDYKRVSDKEWDLYIKVNNTPFILESFKIGNIKQNRLDVSHDDFIHDVENESFARCSLCKGEKSETQGLVCEVVKNEMRQLMEKYIFKELFDKMFLYEMIIGEMTYVKDIKQMINPNKEVSIHALGVSGDQEIAALITYEGERFVYKLTVLDEGLGVVPMIYAKDESSIYLNLEYLLPEHIFTIMENVNNELKNSNRDIHNFVDIPIEDLFHIDFD